jgi:hypothetical protein
MMAEDADWVEDGAVVELRLCRMVPQVEMAAYAASGLAGIEVAGVTVALEDHVAGLET